MNFICSQFHVFYAAARSRKLLILRSIILHLFPCHNTCTFCTLLLALLMSFNARLTAESKSEAKEARRGATKRKKQRKSANNHKMIPTRPTVPAIRKQFSRNCERELKSESASATERNQCRIRSWSRSRGTGGVGQALPIFHLALRFVDTCVACVEQLKLRKMLVRTGGRGRGVAEGHKRISLTFTKFSRRISSTSSRLETRFFQSSSPLFCSAARRSAMEPVLAIVR